MHKSYDAPSSRRSNPGKYVTPSPWIVQDARSAEIHYGPFLGGLMHRSLRSAGFDWQMTGVFGRIVLGGGIKGRATERAERIVSQRWIGGEEGGVMTGRVRRERKKMRGFDPRWLIVKYRGMESYSCELSANLDEFFCRFKRGEIEYLKLYKIRIGIFTKEIGIWIFEIIQNSHLPVW